MTPEEHALKVAALKVLSDMVSKQYKAAREEAEKAFEPARRRGLKQLAPTLPDGTELGTVSIKAGEVSIRWDEDALYAWVAERAPTELVERLTRSAATDAGLLAFVRDNRPDLIETVVRDSYRDVLKKILTVPGGLLVDERTGEAVKVADVTRHLPTGAFAFRASDDAEDAVAEAWRTGQLALDGTLLALPSGDES